MMKTTKKKSTVFFLLLLSCVVVKAQTVTIRAREGQQKESKKSVLDTATIRCYYLFEKNVGTEHRRDTMVLDIGARYSRFYSPARLSRDSAVRAAMLNINPATIKSISVLKEESARDLSNMPGTTLGSDNNGGESYQIFKERAATRLSYSDYTSVMGDNYEYEDDLGSLGWKMGDSTRTILSYSAADANLHFRGRDYHAWFTSDIPANDGPWKFMGLPGLILSIADTRHEFSFSLIGIEQLAAGVPIVKETKKVFRCKRADLDALKRKQDGGIQINNNSGVITISSLPRSLTYFPIELE